MALRFSFFDRVLGVSPQVVGCYLLSPIVRMVEFTISRLGQSYSVARLMSSLLPVSGVQRCTLRGLAGFALQQHRTPVARADSRPPQQRSVRYSEVQRWDHMEKPS